MDSASRRRIRKIVVCVSLAALVSPQTVHHGRYHPFHADMASLIRPRFISAIPRSQCAIALSGFSSRPAWNCAIASSTCPNRTSVSAR